MAAWDFGGGGGGGDDCGGLVAGTASNREVKLLLTVSFLNDALGLEL